MKINNNDNTNFKGAFVFRPQSAQVKDSIPGIIRKGRQIFYNIKSEGDVVLVTKDKYDRKVKDFINEQKIPFEYYPEISTKSGLDDQIPEKLKKIIGVNDNCMIKNVELLNKFLSNKQLHLSNQIEYIKKAIDTLRLNIENAKININDKGLFVVRDNAGKRTILTPGFKSGKAYLYIRPDSLNQDSRRVLINHNGENILNEYNAPYAIKDFNRLFKQRLMGEG